MLADRPFHSAREMLMRRDSRLGGTFSKPKGNIIIQHDTDTIRQRSLYIRPTHFISLLHLFLFVPLASRFAWIRLILSELARFELALV